MTFIRGVRGPVLGRASGNTIDEYFGPLDVSPGLWDGGVGEVGEEGGNDCTDIECCCLEGLGGRGRATSDDEVALGCPPDGSQLYLQWGDPTQLLVKGMA